jgi:hypothetical protein
MSGAVSRFSPGNLRHLLPLKIHALAAELVPGASLMQPAFLITIDTEGDNLWAAPRRVTTENSRFLPRFQKLCELFGLKPTYLTNYEMACCPVFGEFAKRVLRDQSGEIGMHLHAWDSPPHYALTCDDLTARPYLIEYPADVLRPKIAFMTKLLEDTFGRKMTSHRAGRWAFNGIYARALIEHGYLVDCSVTPGHSWESVLGDPSGNGGSDYTKAPAAPYFVDPLDPRRPGLSSLLEAPMTIMANPVPPPVNALREKLPARSFARRVLNRLVPAQTWLRPNGRNRAAMLRLMREALVEKRAHVEFMLHSSELMPGGSPTFRSQSSIESLYHDIGEVFAAAKDTCEPLCLTEFAQRHGSGVTRAEATSPALAV